MDNPRFDALMRDGFCSFPGVLTPEMLDRLTAATDGLLDKRTDEQRQANRTQGSMISTMGDPIFADLVTLPAALDCLAQVGSSAPTFTDGYVISKPPRGPRLFWHYDWFSWRYPSDYETPPPQVFLMYYLSDTQPVNGCLRVIPGSHVNHNALHDLLREPHSGALGRAAEELGPEFSTRPDEIDIPVKAGDLLIGDARLLHATHRNQTDERRTVITLWCQPTFERLPEPTQAQMAAKSQKIPEWWPAAAQEKMRSMMPAYSGSAEPTERMLYRPRITGTVQLDHER